MEGWALSHGNAGLLKRQEKAAASFKEERSVPHLTKPWASKALAVFDSIFPVCAALSLSVCQKII